MTGRVLMVRTPATLEEFPACVEQTKAEAAAQLTAFAESVAGPVAGPVGVGMPAQRNGRADVAARNTAR